MPVNSSTLGQVVNRDARAESHAAIVAARAKSSLFFLRTVINSVGVERMGRGRWCGVGIIGARTNSLVIHSRRLPATLRLHPTVAIVVGICHHTSCRPRQLRLEYSARRGLRPKVITEPNRIQ